jgi:hypothetical protein
MNRPPSIIDRLIAYWSAREQEGEDSDLLCREITRELAGSMPRSLLAVLQAEPQRHREAIDEMIRAQLGLTGEATAAHPGLPSRDLRPAPAVPATSRPQAPATPVAFAQPPDPEPSSLSYRADPAMRREPLASLPPAGRSQTQTVSGEGNTVFATGDIGGPFQFTSPVKPGKPKGSSSPRLEDLPDPDSPIRILFLGANPADSSPLRLDQEVREIDRSLTSASLGHRFQLHQKWAVRASELQSHLLRCKPQILHFSGHGSRQRGIFLESEDGVSRPVAGPQLARLLGQFNQNLRCVVLNACYSEEQAHDIAQEIDCVVGMSTAVADRAAIRFAAVFYEALAYGSDVRAAFELCRSDVIVGELGQDEVPQLLTRRRAAETIRFAPPVG